MVIAGGELAINKRLFDAKPSCLVVIVLTGVVGVSVNVAAGLLVGLVAELLRGWWVRRARPGTAASGSGAPPNLPECGLHQAKGVKYGHAKTGERQ